MLRLGEGNARELRLNRGRCAGPVTIWEPARKSKHTAAQLQHGYCTARGEIGDQCATVAGCCSSSGLPSESICNGPVPE